MVALPVLSDPESERNRAFSRAKQALNKVGAKPAKRARPSHLKLVRPPKEEATVLTAIEAMNRMRAANDNASPKDPKTGERTMPPPAGMAQRGPRPAGWPTTPPPSSRSASGTPGPQRIVPPLNNAAFELNRQQAEARLAETEAAAETDDSAAVAAADLPIEEGRVFLELEPQRPFVTEEERERARQQAMLEIQRQVLVTTPSGKPAESNEAEPEAAESRQIESKTKRPAAAPQAYAQQIAMQAELAAEKTASARADEQQRMKSAVESIARVQRLRETATQTYEAIRLLIQAFSVETVVAFFTLILDMNVKTIKQFIAAKLEFPPFYFRTSKPSMALTMATGCLDFALLFLLVLGIGIPVTIIVTVILVFVKYDVFRVIYGFFAALFL